MHPLENAALSRRTRDADIIVIDDPLKPEEAL